ncbi:MAG: 5-formyltetrahydrofolate cyclo-ligase [Alphaproteobacteria bacterium]|nr:5-formyltetrahydrofolate cyclo-ligase [Alphaproteobacteria bacterium]
MSVDEAKLSLRAEAKARRQAAFQLHGRQAAEELAGPGLGFLGVVPPLIVSGFQAIGDEIDPGPLMEGLHGQGFQLAFPVIAGKGRPLVMRSWSPGEALEVRTWGIAEPLPSAKEVFPDIVLVPLLAFDAEGYRLGYGGGFYDRTLAQLRAKKRVIAVGVAFDEQRVDAVPRDVYDQPCDWVLTPSGALKCGENI